MKGSSSTLRKGGGFIGQLQTYEEYLWIQTLRQQQLPVYLFSPLGVRSVQLDCAHFKAKVAYVLAPRPLPDYVYAVTSVDGVTHVNYGVAETGELRFKDVDWTLETVRHHSAYPFIISDYDDAALAARDRRGYDRSRQPAANQVPIIRIPASDEVEVNTEVPFSVVMKVGGVEKARITAYSDAGSERA